MIPSKIIAIHQPNFFPWLGYFNKIARSDQFVILDNVQFPKKGGTWSNRVKLSINGDAKWITMPIIRSYHGTRTYHEMQINNQDPWQSKVIKTIKANYQKSPFFKEIFPIVFELTSNSTESLVSYNLNSIYALAKLLDFDPQKIILASELQPSGAGTDLLISITQLAGGTAYLSGGGASGAQEDEKFAQAGLDLIYQNFQHPSYSQINSLQFIPGLSIIDTLLNCGIKKTRQLIINRSI